jgi:lipid II:glycine glycyltransferase (peptidoglycan interpeptide bridge formation enzyme)
MPALSSVQPNNSEWDEFVIRHEQGHLLQTTRWGELKSRFGWTTERVALSDPSQAIVAGAQILYRRLPYGIGTLAYVPKGPLVDCQDSQTAAQLVDALDQAALARGALALSVEPNLADSPESAELVSRTGFVQGAACFQPRRTLVVDIRPEEADILASMKSKTRYNIRLADRKGVTVFRGKASDVETFNQLLTMTGARNEFGVRSPDYIRTAFGLFDQVDQVALFLAEFGHEPLAGIMVFANNQTAWYFFGASSDAHRNLMAPYAVQWAAIQWAKSRGCTHYDLWGVPDEDEDTLEGGFASRDDGLWGVYRFKRGFGGRLTRTVGPWDRIYHTLRYRLYRWALRWR